ERDRLEGAKDRPSLVIAVAVVEADDKDQRPSVLVLAATHSPPGNQSDAVELPRHIKQELGLDDEPSWIVTTEATAFRWPGPELHPFPGREGSTSIYGRSPAPLLTRMAQSYRANRKAGRGRIFD